jgi:eukaryotic-like serine/threonine-protein kinase
MIKKIIDIIRSKIFLLHFSLSVGVGILVLFCTYLWLSSFTNHGESITVPDLKGMKFQELEAFLEDKNMQVKIADSSTFMIDKPPGVVIEQDPAPNEKVKDGRTIYVTITRTVPPQVKLPNLIDVSQRQAEAILNSYGLRVGQLIYKPDLAKNAVLSVLFNGASLKPGDEIKKGSVVDLVLGDGIGNTTVDVPDFKGLTLDEVLFVLQGSSLNQGAIVFDESVRDSSSAKVYRQIPEPGDSSVIKQGESIDFFFTQNPEKLK